MKVIIDSCEKENLEVEEFLEPNFVTYGIKKGETQVFLTSYEAEKLIDVLKFLTKNE